MKQKVFYLSIFVSLTCLLSAGAQNHTFTRQDSLRGSITPEREWWDLIAYRLQVKPDIKKQSLRGWNWVVFKPIDSTKRMQIDLQPPMQIDEVKYKNAPLHYDRDGNVYWLNFEDNLALHQLDSIQIFFSGKPKISASPPWDGGLTWTKDDKQMDFIATSVQGEGASLWWPCKDHMYDEVERMDIYLDIPKPLFGVANGRLVETEELTESNIYHWQVKNPINNYGVNMNIGNYVQFHEVYSGLKGKLDLDYFVLEQDLSKAKKQFKQVPKMLDAFEYWFGPYPFYEDSFKLVQVPYLGMEHQSSVTYGNGFQNGYRGYDLSGTGWGLKFDFIIIHEAGHEWFANNITNRDIADMWIHESFTAYSESLYLEYYFGKEAGQEYVRGTRSNILNDSPIISNYNVNQSGSGDMYYKGANMLNTIRTWLNDDILWRSILTGLNKDFYHQTVSTEQIEEYIIQKTNLPLKELFEQYLKTTDVPQLDVKLSDKEMYFRYFKTVPNFSMPLNIVINGEKVKISPNSKWQKMTFDQKIAEFDVDPNYYIRISIK